MSDMSANPERIGKETFVFSEPRGDAAGQIDRLAMIVEVELCGLAPKVSKWNLAGYLQ